MAQRVGPVTIEDTGDDDDLTVIMVPTEAVGFVTGSQGNFLRQVEEEWGTLMFFADFRGRDHGRQARIGGQTKLKFLLNVLLAWTALDVVAQYHRFANEYASGNPFEQFENHAPNRLLLRPPSAHLFNFRGSHLNLGASATSEHPRE